MCEVCGCGDTRKVTLDVHERILSHNDAGAAHNRAHFLEAGVLAINVMGSPGAGKTALLEATGRARAGQWTLGAVSGDLSTDFDAQRLSAAGIDARAITTGNACHLDAEMVHQALHTVQWRGCHIFFIENVGNLVCPAVYDLGQAANVVLVSVTEGEDKPLKYPTMFRAAELVVLTKVDLSPHLPGYDTEAFRRALKQVMPRPYLIELSARTGEGLEDWLMWLASRLPATSPLRR